MALKTISNSCRFNDNDTAYLERTFGGVPTDPDKWTVSFWTKRGNLSLDTNLFSAGINSANREFLRWSATDELSFVTVRASAVKAITTTELFRDPSKWYHIVCSYDSGNATVNDRLKLYVDGIQVTSFSAQDAMVLNDDSYWMGANVNRLGSRSDIVSSLYDGYLSEFFSVDGSVLAATAFGEFATNGSWQPIEPSVTFGTNGFQLDFVVAPGTGNGAGTDVSGNTNHFTDNGLAANDQHTDSPTNNVAILNPLDHGGIILTEGNRAVTASAAAVWRHGRGTIWANTGKWYFESKVDALSAVNELMFGWTQFPATLTDNIGADIYGWGIQWTATTTIRLHNNAAFTTFTDTGTLAVSDVVGVAVDIDAGKIWFRYNGTWLDSGDPGAGTNPAATDANISKYIGAPAIGSNSTTNRGLVSFNTDDLSGSIPTGFKTFQVSSLDDPTIENPADHFDIVAYTGNGINPRSFSSLNFSPDIGWIKAYDGASSHLIGDRVRGGGIASYAALDSAETTVNSGGDISSYDAAGFTVDAGGSGDNAVNDALFNYVTYLFNEGAIPGIDIVTWTGDGLAQTLSHNLNNAPDWITAKRRDGVSSWNDYLSDVLDTSSNPEANPEQQRLIGEADTQALLAPNAWNDTLPNSTQFTVGTDLSVNLATYFAYLFEQIAGFSYFGSYAGNGSADGGFLWTGFRSKFLVIKRTDAVASWVILDSSRSPINPRNKTLLRDVDSAESTANDADFLANGIKLRSSAAAINASGGEYVFMTFAEMSFKWASMFVPSTIDGAVTIAMSAASTASQPKAADGAVTASMSVAARGAANVAVTATMSVAVTGTNATIHADGAVTLSMSVAAQTGASAAVTMAMSIAATGIIKIPANVAVTMAMSIVGTITIPDHGRLVMTMAAASTATRTSLILGTSVAIPLVAPSGIVVNSPVINGTNVIVPLIALDGIVDNGVTAVGNAVLPVITLDASMAGDGIVVLPVPQVTATMIAGRILTGAVLPVPRVGVNGVLAQSSVLFGSSQLVNVKLNGIVLAGAKITASLSFPNLQANATITAGQVLNTPVGALHSISGTRNTGAKHCP